MEEDTLNPNTILFSQLLLSFQTAAMQHLGKIANPLSGQFARDLQQARMTISMLEMLQDKCRGNLSENEERFLKHLISELKLNYVDELGRPERGAKEEATQQTASA